MRVPILLTVLALVSPAVAAGETPATGTIRGRIYNAETLRALSTTYVEIGTEDGLRLGTVGTDRRGLFRLDGVPAGFHRLVAWHGAEGCDPLPEIAVRPGEEVRNVELVLEPRAVVRLRVETPSGRDPVIERCVLESPPDLMEAIPTGSGSLEIRARPGTWTLHLHARGFRTHVETLELEEYDRTFLTVELSPGVSVVGKVRDEEGTPIEGALVERLRVDEPICERGEWTTDRSGRFDLAGGAPAATRFRVSAAGHEPIVTSLDLEKAGFILRHGFVLRRLQTTGAVAGTIVDGAGRPVAGVRIEASVLRSPLRVASTSGADGSFRIDGLPLSQLLVRPADEHGEFLEDSAYARPGGEPVRLVRRRRPVVDLTVGHPGGTAPPLWRARLELADGEVVRKTLIGENRVRITLPHEGTATLSIDAPGHPSPEPVTVEAKPDEVNAVRIEVPARRLTGTLATWLVTRDDIPLDVPHHVLVTRPDGSTATAATNALGGLVLRQQPPGRYTLRAVRDKASSDPDSPALVVNLEEDGTIAKTLRADPALVVVEDRGDGEGPLRVGDGLTWAAGTRMETQGDLGEVLEFFGDREIGLEFVRAGEAVRLRTSAASLKRYRLVPSLR